MDLDNPVEYYKFKFPEDTNAELVIKGLMLRAGNEYIGKQCIDLQELEDNGVSKLELDILTLVEIDNM